MSNNTFIPLRKTTVSVAATSIDISLSGITGYKDLVITTNASITTSGGQGYRLYFNGDYTLANYNFLYVLGTGSSVVSGAGNGGNIGNADTTKLNAGWIEIQDFTNNGRAKVFFGRAASPDSYSIQYVSRWSGTSPITSIRIEAINGNLSVGSVFSVYGVEAFTAESSAKATGGIVTSDSTYWYHTFPFSGTFTPSQSITCDVLTVGGGSSGIYGNYSGPGGGGGEAKVSTSQSLSATSYAVTVGGGGAKSFSGASWNPGTTTSFNSINALGAGQSPYTTAGYSGTGYAYNGGAGGSTASEYTGGGGGSTGAGTTAAGGPGLTTSISGVSNSYGGGGGGGLGTNYTVGASYGRGTDGGGDGASNASAGLNGIAGRGGGGGGGTVFRGTTNGAAGNGGSGVVIVRYAK